jgi:hypothetical protein
VRLPARKSLMLLVVIGFGVVTAAAAQVRFEAGPAVGWYSPLGSFAAPAYYSSSLPLSPGDLAGPTVGAQARLWLGNRLGIQMEATAAYSQVGGGNTPAGPLPATSARVYIGTTQLLYDLMGSNRRSRLWLSGGVGVVNHGGEAYLTYQRRTHLAGALGLGASVPIGPKFRFALGLTTLAYGMDVRDALGNQVEHGTQFDAQLQTGLSWGWR